MANTHAPPPNNQKVATDRFIEVVAAGRRWVAVGPTDRQLAAVLKITPGAVRDRINRLKRLGIVRPVFQGFALTDEFAKRLPPSFDKMDKKRQSHFIAKALESWNE